MRDENPAEREERERDMEATKRESRPCVVVAMVVVVIRGFIDCF